MSRILNAALEVFSEYSFGNATTDEVARRARVSKRDLYSTFPNKHALLAAVINRVLQLEDETFAQVLADGESAVDLGQELESIGLALTNELLSPATGYLSRLISSESLEQPQLGALYFENWYARRRDMIAKVLARHRTRQKRPSRGDYDTNQAAKQFMALMTHMPQLTVFLGMRSTWNLKSVQAHVSAAVECFLRAYPK